MLRFRSSTETNSGSDQRGRGKDSHDGRTNPDLFEKDQRTGQCERASVELRIAPNLFVFRKANCNLCEMQEFEEIIEKLLEAARKLPPGARRHGVLKEIGLFRMRMDALSVQSGKSKSAK